jgi:hypothetical protein
MNKRIFIVVGVVLGVAISLGGFLMVMSQFLFWWFSGGGF